MRRGRYWAGSLALLALVGASAAFAAGGQSGLREDLAKARAATAGFHDLGRAEAAGYVEISECVAEPGHGAMGFHYARFGLMADPAVDAAEPEMLLYVPSASGGLRLVGVEYYRTDADQNLATDGDRPFLFGRGFDGPMPGHGPGQPIHYDLHVWTWQANPMHGLFAPFNPSLDC